MGDTNELMEFLSASLGATLDEIYQRLIDCDFTREDPGLAMFVVALLNALGREGRGNRPTEVVLMLAYGESGTAERGRNRLMRWRRGEMSGHDLAREPGLGEQRDHRLGEMPLPVQPAQPLIGAKRQRDGPGPSHSVDSPTAAPPLKRVRVSEIEIQTSETIETLEKKERDQSELCAKLQEYRAIARERDEWKKKFEDLQVAYKEDELKHLKELYMAKAAKYLVVAGSDYLYTPLSLFWPDVIFLTAPKLDWGQAIGMMISVRRVVSMEPQVIVVAGSNDHLQSRGLLSRLTDGSIPSNEVIGEAIMTLLSAMAEVEAAARQRFTMNVVKVIFVLSPGYAALPEPLQFVYTMVTTIAEGIFNVIIPAPNRVVDPDNYYPSRSQLPAVWADISNAIQGLRDCSTTRLVLDEVLGLELSNFARLLKLRPGVDDDHLLVQQVADDLWFRQMDHAENEQGRMIRKNMTSAEEDLMAMALRTKPHNNVWLYLSPRLCTLGEDAFEHAPAIIKEIHVYLKNLFDARELAGGKMLKLMQDVNTISLDKFQADVLATKAQYERSDAILGGMGVGWTPSFLSTCYPKASRNLIASFVKDIRKLSIGLVLALYVTFSHENFVKGPANLFTQALADLRLDGLLTLIAMTYGRLGDLLVLLRYPEQLQGPSREFNAQLETASLKKMKDWRTLLLQYLLQQNRSVTGEDKVATNAGECKQYCGMPLLTDFFLAVMMRIDPLALVHGLREFVTVVYGPVMSFAFPDVQVKAYRNSVLYVNLVSVVDCSVLNWVEQSELRRLASDDRLFGRIAEPGWVLMDFNNHFKCRMGREDLSHIQFNPKLWNLRPVVKDTGEAVGVPQLPGAYAHAKENQQTWLPGSRPLPDQCPRYPPIRRMLLGVTSPIIAPRIGAARDAEKRMLKWSGGMEPRFISWNAAAAHTFDFSFPDAWSRKRIKALPSRRPEVSAETWNEVYSPADDLSRLKWSGEAKVVMLEVARESRGGSYLTIEDLAPHGEELVEFLVDDELFYHAGDMAVRARPYRAQTHDKDPRDPSRNLMRTTMN